MEFNLKYISIFLVVFLLGACVSTSSSMVTSQPTIDDYSVGEKWVWKFKGVTDNGEVRANGIDTREVIDKDGILSIRKATDLIPIAEIVTPESSKTPRYKWPLEAGKRWVYESHWTSEDGTSGKTVQNVEIVSYQEETVEAGKFMAYRIHYKGEISNSRGYRANTEDIILYAPIVKNFIKLTQIQDGYLYVEELKEYRSN